MPIMAGPHWQRHLLPSTTNAFHAGLVESQSIGQGDSQPFSTEQTHQWTLQCIESELNRQLITVATLEKEVKGMLMKY